MSTALLGIVVTLTATLCAGPNLWTRIGPEGGYVESLAVDPQNSATLYAGTRLGLFKSTDSGANWKLVNSARLAPTGASIDAKNPSIMYAGLRSGNAPNGGPWLFKSTDGAASWTLSNSGLEGLQFSGSLTVDPQNPGTIYVATIAYLNLRPQNIDYIRSQIFKSTDGGTTWSPASTGLPDVETQIRSLVIDPQNSRTLYVATGTTRAGVTTGAIFKSTNGGASWSAVFSLVAQFLVIAPQDHNTIYVSTASSGLLKTADAFGTWTQVTPQVSLNLPGIYVNSLVIDPRNANTIYVAAQTSSFNNVFKSVDGGKSWAATGFPSGWGVPASMLMLDPQNSSTVYAAADGAGVLKSTDGGGTWRHSSSGLGGVGVRSFAVDSQDAEQHGLWRPWVWPNAGQLEFQRQIAGICRDVGVDTLDVCAKQTLSFGMRNPAWVPIA